ETRLRVASNPVHGCQANFLTYLYVASNMRAMPENEKPPATRVDSYFYKKSLNRTPTHHD
ncbi:hypothetical protein, partial [Acidaminococcus sp.]|uniref:hypothetical protein n=1 Tax=Acidaminococcus sp. TaxID=1872103 RepID=UPI003AB5FAF4